MAITTTTDIDAAASQPSRIRPHLPFLDGMRGFTALYVILDHIRDLVFPIGILGYYPFWIRVANIFNYGHAAVDVFIVLSGYCLMLPVARKDSLELEGGVTGFAIRRSRRILPPYYAALAISTILIIALPWMRQDDQSSIYVHYSRVQFMPALFAHLALLHNLNGQWIYRFDPPMWSIATEWQIYFVFALVMLPLARRFGALAVALAGCLFVLLPDHFGLNYARFWFIGLFGMGMVGATYIEHNHQKGNVGTADDTKLFGIYSAVLWIFAFAVMEYTKRRLGMYQNQLSDIPVGLATTAMIVYCAKQLGSKTPQNQSLLLRILSSRSALFIGTFSYSLYLIHYPILLALQPVFTRLNLSAPKLFYAEAFIGIPITLACAYGFHLVFERPFLSRR